MRNTLPNVTCVRKNQNLISVYCEGKVADEILEDQAFIIPDGTSRKGVGNLAGAVVMVSSNIRALKCLQIGKGDRENWANPTSTPHRFRVETAWKRPFPRRFNVESTRCVCREGHIPHA